MKRKLLGRLGNLDEDYSVSIELFHVAWQKLTLGDRRSCSILRVPMGIWLGEDYQAVSPQFYCAFV